MVTDVGDAAAVEESGATEEALVDHTIATYDNGIWCIHWTCKPVWLNYGIRVN